MKKESKAQSPKPNASIEQLLKEAGFSKVRKINKRILHASLPEAESLKPNAFSTAHAAFLQAACKHPALIGCSEFPSVGNRVLIVHREEPAASKPETGNLKPETAAVPKEKIVNQKSEIGNAD